MKLFQTLAAIMGFGVVYTPERRRRGHREKRQCLATGCTTKHNHKNAYCSAECCKAHRAEQKERRHVCADR